MKRILALVLAAAMLLGLTACNAKTETPATDDKKPIKVGIVLSTGGLGDKNFNDMCYDGLMKAQEDFGIAFDYVEPKSASDFESMHRMFAESGEYDLIIGLAADQKDAIVAAATDFPDQKYTYIDSDLDMANVSSIYTKWQEQTFLCGVLAGLATQSKLEYSNAENVIGVILGMEIPNLRKGIVGFTAGARYVNPDCEVLEAVVDSFNDPAKAKQIALSMYSRGADMIQCIAGASGLGVFAAALENKAYAFGVGGNQNALEPDAVIATSIRNVNEIVYNEVKAFIDGTWADGVHISGIKEGAVGYSVEASNVKVPQEILDIVDDVRSKIVSGELVICETAEELDAWVAANQYSK